MGTTAEYQAKVFDGALHLTWGRISDLSPLAGLTELTKLDIADNPISNLSALRRALPNTEIRT